MVSEAELAAELEEQDALFKEIAKEVAGFFASATKTSQWTEVKDGQGKSYFWNQVTNETSWDKPPGFDPTPPKSQLALDISSRDEVLEGELQAQKTLQDQLNAEMRYWVNLANEQAKVDIVPAPTAAVIDAPKRAPPSPKPPPPAEELKQPLPPSPRPAPPSPSPRPPAPTVDLLPQQLLEQRAEQDELARQILTESLHWIQVAKAQAESTPAVEEAKKAPPPSPKLPPPSPKLPPPSPKVHPPSPKPPAPEEPQAAAASVARPPPPSPGPRPPSSASDSEGLEKSLAEERELQEELQRQIRSEASALFEEAKKTPELVPGPRPPSSASDSEGLEKSLAEERELQEELQRQIRAEASALFEEAKKTPELVPAVEEAKKAPPPSPKLPPPSPKVPPPSPKPPAPEEPQAAASVARPPPPSPGPRPPSSASDSEGLEKSLAEERELQEELQRQIRAETSALFQEAKKAAVNVPPAEAKVEEAVLPLPPSPRPPAIAPPARAAPPSPAPPKKDLTAEDLTSEQTLQAELKRQILEETSYWFNTARKQAMLPPVPSPPSPKEEVKAPFPSQPAPSSLAPPVNREADLENSLAEEQSVQQELKRQIRVEEQNFWDAARNAQVQVGSSVPAQPPLVSTPPPPRVSTPPPTGVTSKPPPPSPGARPPPPRPDGEHTLKAELAAQEELLAQIRVEEKSFFEAAKKEQAIAAPPSDWIAVVDAEGKTYYWNQKTDQTSWDKPEGFGEDAGKKEEDKQREEEEQRKKELEAKREAEEKTAAEEKEAKEKEEEAQKRKSEETKSAWEAVQDGEGKTYYWNRDTNETSWDKPPGFGDKSAAANLEEENRLKEELKLAADKEEKEKAEREAKEKEEAGKLAAKESKAKDSAWEAVQDGEGKTYYWNRDTNETSWDKPAGFGEESQETKQQEEEAQKKKQQEAEEAEKKKAQDEEEAKKLQDKQKEEEKAKGWKAVKGANGETYYWNQKTDETSWEKPPGFVDEEEKEKADLLLKEEEAKTKKEQEDREREEKIQREAKEKEDLAVAKDFEEKHSLRPSPPPPSSSSSLPPAPSPSSSSSIGEEKASLTAPPPPVSLRRDKTTPPPPLIIPVTPPAAPTQRIFAISASSPSPSPRPPPPRPFPPQLSPKPAPPREEKASEATTLEEELAEQKRLKSSIAELESNFMIEAETRLVTVPDDKKSAWVAVKDADGGVYYWNQETGATTWLQPEDFEGPVIDPNVPSPKGKVAEVTVEQKLASQLTPDEFTRHLEEALNTTAWKQVSTPDGEKYWWNQDTGETSWLEPERVQVDPIIPKALALTSRRAASAQRAEARARLKQELEDLDREDREAGDNSALIEQKTELSHYDDIEHLGQAAELLMASMGSAADRQRIQELEAKVESLQQTNVTLVRKLIEVQDDRHGLSVKLINLLESQAKAADDLRKREELLLQKIIADAESKRV